MAISTSIASKYNNISATLCPKDLLSRCLPNIAKTTTILTTEIIIIIVCKKPESVESKRQEVHSEMPLSSKIGNPIATNHINIAYKHPILLYLA